MRIFRSLIFYCIFYFWTVFFFFIFSPIKFFSRKQALAISGFWIRTIMGLSKWILLINYQTKGIENLPKEQFIVASNHQSAWETFYLPLLFRNYVFVLKKDLIRIPLLNLFFAKLGFIFVDKNENYSSMKSLLRHSKDRVSEGVGAIIIFPEGTRVKPGVKKKLSPGVAALYKSLNLPVLPVKHDSGKFWLNKKILKNKGKITIEIFPPIKPGLKKENLMNKLENLIQ